MASVIVQANAFVAKPAAVKARAARRTVVQASARKTWYPAATPPSYLNGSMVGGKLLAL